MTQPEVKNTTEQSSDKRDALTEVAASQFKFHRFVLTNLAFQELQKTELAEGEEKPSGVELQLELSVLVGLSPNGRESEVRMTVQVTPNPKVKPYLINVQIAGYFSTVDGTKEQLEQFSQRLAPAILFPYVREIVDRTTLDGRYGVVRLNPMNFQQTLSQEWKSADKDGNVLP